MEELITLDAIGCFEDDDDYEEEGSEDEEEGVVSEQVSVLFEPLCLYNRFIWLF